jgi:hypothetical protein
MVAIDVRNVNDIEVRPLISELAECTCNEVGVRVRHTSIDENAGLAGGRQKQAVPRPTPKDLQLHIYDLSFAAI